MFHFFLLRMTWSYFEWFPGMQLQLWSCQWRFFFGVFFFGRATIDSNFWCSILGCFPKLSTRKTSWLLLFDNLTWNFHPTLKQQLQTWFLVVELFSQRRVPHMSHVVNSHVLSHYARLHSNRIFEGSYLKKARQQNTPYKKRKYPKRDMTCIICIDIRYILMVFYEVGFHYSKPRPKTSMTCPEQSFPVLFPRRSSLRSRSLERWVKVVLMVFVVKHGGENAAQKGGEK